MTSQPDTFAWWQTDVIYQIYPRSFNDSDGDGNGDLQGIIDRLDYLNNGTPASLGINTIWISPIYPSPMADLGYDIANYTDIHPLYGDLDTFDRLIAEAHRRGIRVLLDFVPNHTSDEHPWFIESRSSRDNPKRDWYLWKDPRPDGTAPNNWASMFGGPAWSWDEATGQYYLHLFSNKQPDLNWRNADVREAMLDVLRFWLDRGADGFRMDVVGFIIKDVHYRDNPLLPHAAGHHPNDLWSRQEHIYDIDRPEVHDLIREFRMVHDAYGDRATVGEVWAAPRARWVEYYGRQLDGLHLPFNFDLLFRPWQACDMRASVDELEAALPPGAWPTYVLGSHDVSRLATRFGARAVRVAAMMLLTLRGTPTIYMGDELGMVDGEIPPQRLQDPQGLNIAPERSRDPYRTPFQWSAEPHAGFSTVEPWLPVAAGYRERNVANQMDDPGSVLSLYRRLIHYRRHNPPIACGAYRSIDVEPADCFVYLRTYRESRRLIALNFGEQSQSLALTQLAARGTIVISTALDREEAVSLRQVVLRPDEGVIIEL